MRWLALAMPNQNYGTQLPFDRKLQILCHCIFGCHLETLEILHMHNIYLG